MARKTITQSELARALGVSRQAITRMVNDGRVITVSDDRGTRVVPLSEARRIVDTYLRALNKKEREAKKARNSWD